jgi:serine/threonine protein kinase
LADKQSVPDRIKRYEIIRMLGEGGMGQVYLAMDKIIRRPVAVKMFFIDELTGSESSKETALRDFFLETQTSGALLHPNIVVTYDVGKSGDLLYIVMEYVFGKTLLDHQRGEGIGVRKAVEIGYEVATALDYAHSKGVVHRDIKPENIILSTKGVPKVTDFGIARFRKNHNDRREKLVGSSRFMAPEQVNRNRQDHRVDIYQLGVVLYELLTRLAPFKGVDFEATIKKIKTETPPPPSKINLEVTTGIDAIVMRCLDKNPEKRFGTAKHLAESLAECLRSGTHRGLEYDPDLVSRLKQFEMFLHFSDQETDEIAKIGEFVEVKSGEAIIRENEDDSNFFVLLEGNVKVVKQSRVLTNFLPGSCFGEIGAFARQERAAGVVAVEDCKLLRINALLFQEMDSSIQLKILRIVVGNLASLVISLDNEIMQLTNGTGHGKTIATVCPACGYDNKAIIEVCPHCGVIPSKYPERTTTTRRRAEGRPKPFSNR